MAQGNRSFVQGLAEDASPAVPLAKLPPRTSVLQNRENRLSQLANGQSVNRVHELVDPARCRIWEAHNRDYGALDESTCADLIESFKAQGRQEVPAIVRRLRSDAAFDFEVICGARRHWTVTWMRQHGYPTSDFWSNRANLTTKKRSVSPTLRIAAARTFLTSSGHGTMRAQLSASMVATSSAWPSGFRSPRVGSAVTSSSHGCRSQSSRLSDRRKQLAFPTGHNLLRCCAMRERANRLSPKQSQLQLNRVSERKKERVSLRQRPWCSA